MGDFSIKNYITNLSLQKGIPKIIFLVLYVGFLALSILFIKTVENNYKNTYVTFFNEKITSQDFTLKDGTNQSYEDYHEQFNGELGENSHIKNLSFIIWSFEGDALWHSNKLLKKGVEKDAKENNKLFKTFNFLDIPEKNFKPYETFKANKEAAQTQKVITTFYKKTIHHFYSLKANQKIFYVEVLREYQSIIPASLYAGLLGFILIISGVLTVLSYLLIKLYLTPVNNLKASMESYIENKSVELVYNVSENEIGALVKTYNAFLGNLSTFTESHFDDTDGKNQKVIDYLQEMLLKKSIQKSQQMELLLFPRRPGTDFRMFVTIEEREDVTFLLYMHFDINNIQSNLEKHIIQDRFKELVAKTTDMNDISTDLFKDLVAHADLGPGFLLIRLSGNEMDWVRSGPFFMYLLDHSNGSGTYLDSGLEYLPTEIAAIESTGLQTKYLLVISEDVLNLLNMGPEEFMNNVVAFEKSLSGKQLLTQILDNINRENPGALNLSPMISLIRLKS